SKNFAGTVIEASLSALIDDPQFKQWNSIRNVLLHRCEPRRHHQLSIGGKAPRRTDWEVLHGLAIDDQTTTSNRRWLATKLATSLIAAAEFATTTFAWRPPPSHSSASSG